MFSGDNRVVRMKRKGARIAAFREAFMRVVFLAAAAISIVSVILICVLLFANGFPAIIEIGPLSFLGGVRWKPSAELFGIAPMIVGSLYVTAGAILIGVPIGLLTAIYIEKFAGKKLVPFIRQCVSLMAGIPSVVYGLFGLIVLVPFVRDILGDGSSGKGMLTASILLGLMILPTIISVSAAAIAAVPETYYEGALALGATHERSVFFTVLPAAKSGVLASIVLGIGRAIGETMAVMMVAGNQAVFPESISSGIRTLTANIAIEMGYAADLHRDALIATAVVLFVFILLINLLLSVVKKGEAQ